MKPNQDNTKQTKPDACCLNLPIKACSGRGNVKFEFAKQASSIEEVLSNVYPFRIVVCVTKMSAKCDAYDYTQELTQFTWICMKSYPTTCMYAS